jgi:hypothetical protein
VVTASGKKTDLKKQGLESIKDDVVKANLMGVSRKMNQKGWTDSQGRKGKVRRACTPACRAVQGSASFSDVSIAISVLAEMLSTRSCLHHVEGLYTASSLTTLVIACMPYLLHRLAPRGGLPSV